MTETVSMRVAEASDADSVLDLLRVSLGKGSDPVYEDFFRWKHEESPFGRSPSWVACADGRVVGFRTFMRWEFDRDGRTLHAVRAVDTATAPEFRGRGIFSQLTRGAVEDLRADGVDLVFNTPNEQSRPGYLKLGWQLVGRLPVLLRPRTPLVAPRILRARAAAALWSEPTTAGEPIGSAQGLAKLVTDPEAMPGGLRTRRSDGYLAWRYGFAPLHYRVLQAGDGAAIFRIRRRGAAVEAVVAEISAPSPAGRRRLVAAVLRASRADYAIRIGPPSVGEIPVPGMGPTLTCLPISGLDVPPLSRWHLQMGDIELF